MTTQRGILRAAREAIIQYLGARIRAGVSNWFRQGAARDDAGAAMVELAMVFVLLVMLLVGTVSAAVAYGRGNSIQNAAREASRFGATLADVSTNLNQIIVVAKSASSGDLDTGVPGYYICVAYVDGAANVRMTEGTLSGLPGDGSCYSDGRPAGERRVQVIAGRDTTINAILFSTDVSLSTEAAARYER